MARNAHTPEMLESIAAELSAGVDTLKTIASLMRDNKMSSALLHGTTSNNRYVPAILDWIEKTSADVRTQLRAHLAGVQSDAERRKQYNDNQKLAAGRKPVKKKSKRSAPLD